jgi:tetratricopeptide (TPR) repeat protein
MLSSLRVTVQRMLCLLICCSGDAMHRRILVIISLATSLAQPAFGAGQQDHNDCNKARGDVAIEGCTRIINDRDESARNRAVAFDNRGEAYFWNRNPDRAISDFNEAIRLDPNYAQAFNRRAIVHNFKKDHDRAITDYTEAIRLNPKYHAAFNNRGIAHFAKKDNDRAIADYTEAIRLDPNSALYYNNRCYARATANRDLQQALVDCDAALRLRPNHAHFIARRGFVYLRLGRLNEAVIDYDSALKIDSKQAASLYGRGLARLKKGDNGGNADVAAARAIQADIVEEFARYGVN